MEYTATKTSLMEVLPLFKNVIPMSKTALLQLTYVKLETKINSVVISGTNEISTLTCEIPCKVDSMCRVLLPWKTLLQTIKSIHDEEITLTLEQNEFVSITTNKSTVRIKGMDLDGYPFIPEPTEEEVKNAIQSWSEDLKTLINSTCSAMSDDEARVHINGSLLEIDIYCLRMISTDGHRIHIKNMPATTSINGCDITEKISYLINRNDILTLKKALKNSVGRLNIITTQNKYETDRIFNFTVTTKNGASIKASLRTKAIDAKFPPYQKVIPDSNVAINSIQCDKETLKKALKKIQSVTNDKQASVRFTTNGVFKVSSNDPEIGELSETIEACYNNDNTKIAFDASYILDAIEPIETKTVKFNYSTETNGCIVKDSWDMGFLAVVMPMRI